jgi:recombination protein RecA
MTAPDREKALALALAQIEKNHGKGSVMRLGDDTRPPIGVVPTGSIALDVALGVGGLPRGRIVEIYGPESSGKTTVALHAVANAQAAGGIAAFIDAEHALDPEYAKALGVDTDALLVSQPDTGEQALEIADMLIRSGALDIIVIDSVAALVPRAEIEGEMGDSHVGLQARLMSQALRKITGALSSSGTTMIFINQLREKIGVMFGCLSYGTRVTLADGSQEKIGKIVDQKLPVEVLSYDPDLGRVVPKKVVNWFDNGPTDQFLQITVARPGGNGRAQMGLTANHLVHTPGGWREAGELVPGDRVLLSQPYRLGEQQWQVVIGGLMGDAALSPSQIAGSLGTRFRMGHGPQQIEYLDWKASLLGNIGQSRRINSKGAGFVDLTPLPELAELREAVYLGDGHKHLSWDYLKALTPLALAIWYCDDGSLRNRAHQNRAATARQQRTRDGSGRSEICVQALSPGSRERLVQHLADTFDLHPTLTRRGAHRMPVLTFAEDETARLHELIAPYVHPSVQHKLLERFRGRFAVQPAFAPPTLLPMPAPVLDVRVKSRTRSMHRFDIEVEDTHNYLADGVVVHNSPETTTGGKALKFYASVRLDIRRIETLKDGSDMVGNRTRVKVVKNKCLAEGALVFDPATGVTRRIEDIVDNRLKVQVAAVDKAGVMHVRPVVNWFDQGEQEVIGLRLRDGTVLWVTPDHQVLGERGWMPAGELMRGDRVARPREFLGFGHQEPVSAEHARMLGYLIGDGDVGGKTPISFSNVASCLQEDAARIAAQLGCRATARRDGMEVSFAHRPGEQNALLELCRAAGIWGKPAWKKEVPALFFAPDVSADLVANLLFGLLETDGWVGREQNGGIHIGFATTSEQLAHQIHWLLMRWGIGSSVPRRDPRAQRGGILNGRRISAKRACWEVRITGLDNVSAFASAIPAWGPRSRALAQALTETRGRLRGSHCVYLSTAVIEPVLAHLRDRGVRALDAAQLIGGTAGDPRGGMRQVLGASRFRRDRVSRLAEALDDAFLHSVVADQLSYSVIAEVLPARRSRTFDVEVEELHNLVANDVVVHNCAPPFKQAEFDILYGVGISREGSLVDVGVEQGIVRKSGAWYTYEGDQMGQGKENARKFLRDNPDVTAEIDKRIKEKLGIGAQLDADVAPLPAPVDF